MRAPVLLVAALALVAGAGATTWSDTSKIKAAGGTGLAYHGPDLKYNGVVKVEGDVVVAGTHTYGAKSVITGKDSYYPATLPESLKTPYVVPDSTHPELAFW